MNQRAVSATAICLTLVPIAARGQGSQELIPRELVEAIIAPAMALMSFGSPSPNRPIISVGELPEPLARRAVVPPGARVLGGISSGASATGYFVTSLSPDSIRAFYRRELPRVGWQARPPQKPVVPPFGFVDTSSFPLSETARGMVFCSGSDALMIDFGQNGPGTQRVGMSTGSIGQFVCSPRSDPAVRATWGDEHPRLYQPAVVGPNLCPDYSSIGGGTHGNVTSTLSNQELLNSYTRQLVDSGWTPVDLPIVARRFTKRDSVTEHIVEVGVRTPPYAMACREAYMTFWDRRIR